LSGDNYDAIGRKMLNTIVAAQECPKGAPLERRNRRRLEILRLVHKIHDNKLQITQPLPCHHEENFCKMLLH
jgi:hypothetical protein